MPRLIIDACCGAFLTNYYFFVIFLVLALVLYFAFVFVLRTGRMDLRGVRCAGRFPLLVLFPC